MSTYHCLEINPFGKHDLIMTQELLKYINKGLIKEHNFHEFQKFQIAVRRIFGIRILSVACGNRSDILFETLQTHQLIN